MSSQATSLPRRTLPTQAPTAVCSSQWVGTSCSPLSLPTWRAPAIPARLSRPRIPSQLASSAQTDCRNVDLSVCQFVDTHGAPACDGVVTDGFEMHILYIVYCQTVWWIRGGVTSEVRELVLAGKWGREHLAGMGAVYKNHLQDGVTRIPTRRFE